MEPYLTLIIALGGIATGIGAIWTAMLARRQAKDQRKFLEEQNERDRRRLEADLMHGMWTAWTSRAYLDFRRGGMGYVRDHYVKDGKLLQVEHLDGATRELFNFFNELGYLTRAGILRLERVLGTYGGAARLGWALWEPAVKKERDESADPSLYGDFEYLYRKGLEFAEANGPRAWSRPPSTDELLHFIHSEELKAVEVHSVMLEAADTGSDATGP